MLHLFGLTHLPRVVAAYDEAHPLADGWEDRLGIHQLFPLLAHACMFGGSYGARAGTIARALPLSARVECACGRGRHGGAHSTLSASPQARLASLRGD